MFVNGQDPSLYDSAYVHRLAGSGVAGSVVNIGVYNPWTIMSRTPGEALKIAGKWVDLVRRNRDVLGVATSVEQLRSAPGTGRTYLILGFQGLDPIDFSVDTVDVFHALGTRVMQLTYNEANRLGDGCGEDRDGGLTRAGRQFVERIDDLGIVLDLSHAGRRTSLEAVEATANPPIFSHANASALVPSARNVDDEQIRAVAERGGVIGVSMFPPLLARGRDATLDDVVRHVTYLSELAGPEHVGLGLDFPHNVTTDHWVRLQDELNIRMDLSRDPRQGMKGLDQLDELAERLAAEGFSDAALAGIWGENFLRVFAHVWKA